MARLSRFAIALIASAAIVLLLTFGTYALRLWVGGSLTVRDFIFRSSVFLPISVGLVAALWPSPHLKRGTLAAGATGAFVGVAYGWIVSHAMFWRSFPDLGLSVFFHPMILDADIAALLCSTIAGTCAMLLSITSRDRTVLTTVALLVLLAALVPGPIFDLLVHNQELTVAIVTPKDGVNSPSAPEVSAEVYATPMNVGAETTRVLQLLRGNGVSGDFHVADLHRLGHGKQVLVVIVIKQPILSRIELAEPNGANLIYVQQHDGWMEVPLQVPRLDRIISLEPAGEDGIADITINGAWGRSGGFRVWKAYNLN
jgi:hypothetical protein